MLEERNYLSSSVEQLDKVSLRISFNNLNVPLSSGGCAYWFSFFSACPFCRARRPLPAWLTRFAKHRWRWRWDVQPDKKWKKIVLYKTGPKKSRFLLDHECCLHYHSSSNYLSLGVGWSVDNSHQSCLYLLSSPSSSFLYADNSASRASFTPIKSS